MGGGGGGGGGTPLPSKRMLVWDLFKCHFTDAAKTQLQESKSIVVAIPPAFIQ